MNFSNSVGIKWLEFSTGILCPEQEIHTFAPEMMILYVISLKAFETAWHRCNLNTDTRRSKRGILSVLKRVTFDFEETHQTETETKPFESKWVKEYWYFTQNRPLC